MAKSLLSFQNGNKKLSDSIATFSLPAGYTCPGANQCLSRANRQTGYIKDGENCVFRCFSASTESAFPSVRKNRWENFEKLNGLSKLQMIELLVASVNEVDQSIIRVGVSGDFFSQDYFDAWMETARRFPNRLFYAYTKSLPFWLRRLNSIPPNFKLTASRGGKFDALIDTYGLKCAEVVFSQAEALKKGLEIDHDDSHAYGSSQSFALLIHGTQPQGSFAAKALSAVKAQTRL